MLPLCGSLSSSDSFHFIIVLAVFSYTSDIHPPATLFPTEFSFFSPLPFLLRAHLLLATTTTTTTGDSTTLLFLPRRPRRGHLFSTSTTATRSRKEHPGTFPVESREATFTRERHNWWVSVSRFGREVSPGPPTRRSETTTTTTRRDLWRLHTASYRLLVCLPIRATSEPTGQTKLQSTPRVQTVQTCQPGRRTRSISPDAFSREPPRVPFK